jgi:rubrerythrin
MMQMFKCGICGDSYMGNAKPSHCPFCGAPEKYIVLAENWAQTEGADLSNISKANLEHALLLENNSMLFYTCSCEISMNAELAVMFKALARMEAKHASIIRDLLGVPSPEEVEDNRGRCHALDQLNVKDAREREERAVEFYTQAAQAAQEPRVKDVFSAFAEIEALHMELVEDAENRFAVQPGLIT